MIGLENKDTSFFFIAPSDDLKLKRTSIGELFFDKSFAKDIISFSVTEEMGKIDRGTLSIKDDDNFYSQILRSGVSFDLVWGYRKSVFQEAEDIALDALENVGSNLYKGGKNIRKLRGFTVSPGGNGGGDGRIVYNVTFYGTSWIKKPVHTIWEGMPKGEMIRQIMQNQLETEAEYIDFESQGQLLTYPSIIRQNDPPTNFLNKRAKKERAVFKIGTTQDGAKIALFVDNYKIESPNVVAFNKLINGAIAGDRIEFNYRIGESSGERMKNDVQTYNWTHNIGENGTGDGVSLMYLNGKATFFKYVAGQQTTTGYRLNPKKIQSVLKKDPSMVTVTNLLKIDNFETLVRRGFFSPIKITTAPEGFGFRINLTIPVGNPYITTPCRAYFNKGFPTPFTDKKMTFYVQSVTHNVNKNGYSQNAIIADTFTITGGSLIGAVGWTPTG